MKFNIDFSFIIAVLVLIQLLLLGSSNKSRKPAEVRDIIDTDPVIDENTENETYLTVNEVQMKRDLYAEINLCRK